MNSNNYKSVQAAFKFFKVSFALQKSGLLVPLRVSPKYAIKLDSDSYSLCETLFASRTYITFVKKINAIYGVAAVDSANDFILKIVNHSKNPTEIISDFKVKNDSISVSFEVTGRCNLSCFHCYATSERAKKVLSLDKIKVLLDILHENKCYSLQLTGGECMTHPDFAEIYVYARKKGMVVNVSSNLTMLTPKILKAFKDFPPYHVFVSLYGSDAETHESVTGVKGSFKKTIASVKKLKKAGLNVWFNAVVFKKTFENSSEMRVLADKLSVPIVFHSALVPRLCGDTSPCLSAVPEELSLEIKKYSSSLPEYINSQKQALYDAKGLFCCNAGEKSFHVDSCGLVSMCKMYRDYQCSIFDTNFKQLIENIRDAKVVFLQGKYETEECPVKSNLHWKGGDIKNAKKAKN